MKVLLSNLNSLGRKVPSLPNSSLFTFYLGNKKPSDVYKFLPHPGIS